MSNKPGKLPRAAPRDMKRILVVDDEPRMIGFIRMNLELEGYQVIEAHDGLQALDADEADHAWFVVHHENPQIGRAHV